MRSLVRSLYRSLRSSRLMERSPLPQVSPFNLRRSLDAAEALAAQADRTTAADLRRTLLRASCRLLDAALVSADASTFQRGKPGK